MQFLTLIFKVQIVLLTKKLDEKDVKNTWNILTSQGRNISGICTLFFILLFVNKQLEVSRKKKVTMSLCD